MSKIVEMVECDNDSRFKIFFDRNEQRFNVVYLFDEVVYGSNEYAHCLKWAYRQGYLSVEKYSEEM
jgi:hypothetical protein